MIESTVIGGAMEDAVLTLDGVSIRYVAKGSGEPVLLVHGYMVNAEQQWIEPGVFDHLATRFRVYAYDNRGHGQSQKFHRDDDYGVELANDVFRVMDGLALPRVHLVGYSMGAMIAAKAVAMDRGRFSSVTFGGGAGRFSFTPAELAQNIADAADIERGDIRNHLARLWPGNRLSPGAEQLRVMGANDLAGKDWNALACVRRSMHQLATPIEILAAAREPMLGIVGTDDPFAVNVRVLGSAKPAMRLVEIPGASHRDATGYPEFARTVEQFITGTER